MWREAIHFSREESNCNKVNVLKSENTYIPPCKVFIRETYQSVINKPEHYGIMLTLNGIYIQKKIKTLNGRT